MPIVNTSERAIIRGRHHRRPRSPGSSYGVIETFAPMHVTNGVSFLEPPPEHRPLPTVLHYPSPADTVDFFFWSISDGVTGRVDASDPQHFWNWGSTAPVMTAAAWYAPPSGPGVGDGPPDIMVDAMSTATGDVIDDDFLTVVSDGSLTVQANTDGWVPTIAPVILEAQSSIGDLDFDRWILVNAGAPGPEDAEQLLVPARATGMAMAVYTPNGVTYDPPSGNALQWNPFVRDIAAIGGLLLTRGGGPSQSPVESLQARLTANLAIRSLTDSLGVEAFAEIAKVLDADSQAAIKAAAALPPAKQ